MQDMLTFNIQLLKAIADFLMTVPMFYLFGTLIMIVIIDFIVSIFSRR